MTNPPAKAQEHSSARPAENEGSSQGSQEVQSRRPLWIVGGLALVWILGLIVLTITTANPVTLNRQQILRADYVASATRKRADSAILVVRREWKHGETLGEIEVTNLNQVRMPAGREFLVPLERLNREKYLMTPTTLPNTAPLIYPATQEAQAQLEAILQSHGNRQAAE